MFSLGVLLKHIFLYLIFSFLTSFIADIFSILDLQAISQTVFRLIWYEFLSLSDFSVLQNQSYQ